MPSSKAGDRHVVYGLKTAMHLKPSTKSDLQKYLPPPLPALSILARSLSVDRKDAFMSGTIATTAPANVKIPIYV